MSDEAILEEVVQPVTEDFSLNQYSVPAMNTIINEEIKPFVPETNINLAQIPVVQENIQDSNPYVNTGVVTPTAEVSTETKEPEAVVKKDTDEDESGLYSISNFSV
jgi:hypothetical protein